MVLEQYSQLPPSDHRFRMSWYRKSSPLWRSPMWRARRRAQSVTRPKIKKDRDDEFYFAPKTKGAKAKKEAAKTSKQPIKHNAVTFKLFKELDLEAPITTEDIPATLEKLDAKLKYFQDKIKDWE